MPQSFRPYEYLIPPLIASVPGSFPLVHFLHPRRRLKKAKGSPGPSSGHRTQAPVWDHAVISDSLTRAGEEIEQSVSLSAFHVFIQDTTRSGQMIMHKYFLDFFFCLDHFLTPFTRGFHSCEFILPALFSIKVITEAANYT